MPEVNTDVYPDEYYADRPMPTLENLRFNLMDWYWLIEKRRQLGVKPVKPQS
jgi:hypothetical protein